MQAMRKIPPFLLLDAWRGLAALWVVMTHACVAFLATGDNMRFIHFPLYAISVRGQLGVVIFFVISGYCIMGAAYGALASGRSVGRYGFDRIRRIYPPYLCACAVSVAMGFFVAFGQGHHLLPASNHVGHPVAQTWQFWLGNLLLLQREFGQPDLIIIAWSLCYEVVFYLVIGILLAIAKTVMRRPDDTRGVA